jgi:hypothetical protein
MLSVLMIILMLSVLMIILNSCNVSVFCKIFFSEKLDLFRTISSIILDSAFY